MAIPKKIFQTARDFESLPDEYKEHIAELQIKNPDWQYRFFDDEQMRVYIRTHSSAEDWAEIEHVNPKFGVVLADLFRYLIIYNEGGLYLDVKSVARRPLSDYIDLDAEFVISQWPNRIGERYVGYGLHPDLFGIPGGEFQQWCVIAAPNHPFLKAAIALVLSNIRNYTPAQFGTDAMGVLRLSGPIAYTRAIYPLLNMFPFTSVSLADYGIHYTLFEESGELQLHQTKIAGHYSLIREPIVLRDLYVEPPNPVLTRLGDLLAREVQENTTYVLKLAVFSIAATLATLIFILSLGTYFIAAR